MSYTSTRRQRRIAASLNRRADRANRKAIAGIGTEPLAVWSTIPGVPMELLGEVCPHALIPLMQRMMDRMENMPRGTLVQFTRHGERPDADGRNVIAEVGKGTGERPNGEDLDYPFF